ncbi:N-acetyltransferase [Desulfogranum japonicum]|uniref:N-acetyltransferase n=1 Tax=Desulfogranum japonicum TaxID=231447 RepID=UPI00048BCDB6|nr:N-acetyltransferase [Desulfogranum japonicum]
MIRSFYQSDLEGVLNIWLTASIKAHSFMPAEYWQSKVNDMREIYLPASESYVYEERGDILGFLSIYQNNLAAIFVSPLKQGNGIGSKLIEHVKSKYQVLNLCVYKGNIDSIEFYKKHGFTIVYEQIDEHTGHPEIAMKLGL